MGGSAPASQRVWVSKHFTKAQWELGKPYSFIQCPTTIDCTANVCIYKWKADCGHNGLFCSVQGQAYEENVSFCLPEVVCVEPSDPAFATRVDVSHEGKHRLGATVGYLCDDCLSGGGTITCLPNGTWTTVPPCQTCQSEFSFSAWY